MSLSEEWKVYFIRCGKKDSDPVKIGYTKDLSGRLKDLQVGNPYKLTVLFTLPCESRGQAQKLERFLHRQLYHRHHIQGEWFNIKGVGIPRLLHKFNTSHKTFNYKKEVIKKSQKDYLTSLEKENRLLAEENRKLQQDIEEYLDCEALLYTI